MARTRTQSWQKRTLVSLAIALVVAVLLVFVHFLEDVTNINLLGNVELKMIDLRFRLRGPREPSGEVAVVAIDSKSVEAIGRWPWPRTIQAQLVDRLRELGASAVAFDVIFTERQGEREAERLRRIEQQLAPDAGAAREEVATALEEVLIDRQFAAALKRTFDDDAALTVLAFDFVLPEDMVGTRRLGKVLSAGEEQTILDIASYLSRDQNVPYLRQQPVKLALGIRPVITELAEWSAALGYVNPIRDGDGALRRERLAVVYSPGVGKAWEEGKDLDQVLLDPEQRVQAMMPLSVAGVATHQRLTVDQLVLDLEAGELRFPVAEGERTVPFDPIDGTLMIDFYGGIGTIPTYPFVDVLEGELTDAEGRPVDGSAALGGKLVFVGMSDPGLTRDTFTTPFTTYLPGVEKHAMVAENLLEGRLLRRHRDADLVVALSVLGAALLAGLAAGNLSALWAALAVAALGAGFLAKTFDDFVSEGLVWSWNLPILALAATFGLVTAYRQISEQRARRQMEERGEFLQQTFGRYLSDEVVAMLVDSPEGLTLGGEKRVLTILMSDLRGFTAMCERSSPEEVISMLNLYLGSMADLVLKYQGTVDEFIGDAVLALFGAPVAREGDAQRAVACAVEMQQALLEVNAEFRRRGMSEVEMGVALNTGEVIVGNIGSERRSKYGVVGANVNLTARIESYTVGGQVLISGATLEQAGDIVQVGDRVDVAAKGLKEPVPAYQVLSVGGPFNVKLPEIEEVFLGLDAPIEVRFVALSGKKIGDQETEARFLRLSNLGADMDCGESIEALTNLKLTVLDGEGQPLEGDLYAKVVKREAVEGTVPLRFTSVPPAVKKLFKKIRAAFKKREQEGRPDHHRAGTLEQVEVLSQEEVGKA